MKLWSFLRGPLGHRWFAEHYRQTKIGLMGTATFESSLIDNLYSGEEARLLSADPYFVSAEMCEVVEAAKETFDPEKLYPTDFLSPTGFVYYEQPFIIPDRYDREINIAAFSWSPIIGMAEEDPDPAVVQQRIDQGMSRYDGHGDEEGPLNGVAITIYEANPKDDPWPPNAPPLLPMHLTPWWFGMAFEGNEIDHEGKSTGARWWWSVAQVTLRLMQQQMAHRRRERPERPLRREAARSGFPEREVVVVRLRREKREGQDEPQSEANYSHRFIVSGHWRNQWYPKANLHRQIWISPYVKGPEDAPLVVRPRRAYTWSR